MMPYRSPWWLELMEFVLNMALLIVSIMLVPYWMVREAWRK